MHLEEKRLVCFKKCYRGYAVNSTKNYLINELGHELAKLSLENGYDNLGIIYKSESEKKFKVSLRGY